jgi:phosphohistidine phosphatase SixA
MMGWRARVASSALVAVLSLAGALVACAQPLEGPALGDALRRGGYVLFFRHASTDFAQNDAAMRSFDDCARQRNLTDAGRTEARAIGEAIRRLAIPVGEVLASPYCRTVETARLIFGRATPTTAVRGGPSSADGDRYAELKALLARGAPPGTNVAIASHGNPFYAVAGGPYLAEGEAAIIAPGGPNGFTVVGRVRKSEWHSLSPGVAPANAGARSTHRARSREARS